MILRVDDFPLMAIGPMIYARTCSTAVLIAVDADVARTVTESLNGLAQRERPGEIGGPWLTIN